MKELSLRTKAYLFAVYAAGIFVLVRTLIGVKWDAPWMLLALCTAGALASVFKVEGATNRSHYTISFLIYGFTFASQGLPAALTVIAVSNLAEWIWRRPPWFIQIFNTTCYILVMYVASLVYFAINPTGAMRSMLSIAAIATATATFTLLNHLLVGIIVWLARGENFDKSGVFDFLPLAIDMTLLTLGASLVIVWNHNPFALVLFSLPLYLIYSTLRVPSLERQTETDSKTGLFNHGYFMQQIESELNRANRFDRPLAIVMADLDLLRNINNTYGHLAGDEVLVRIAALFKEAVREYDVVARFGGEEFALLMPETTAQQAFWRAEKIRQIIERTQFVISTSVTPISVTVSMGVASRERFDQPAREIIHNADTALYHAKLKGRNQTYVCANQTYAAFVPAQGQNPSHFVPTGSVEPSPAISEDEERDYPAADAVLVRSDAVERDEPKKEPDAPAGPAREHKGPLSIVNLYIAGVMATAFLVWAAIARLSPANPGVYSFVDWLSLATFASLAVIMEWFSIELYVKHTTVSTSAVPILAGTLLFGPVGAFILSATFAVTALIKYRSPVSRLFFNMGNQLIAAMIYTGLIMLTGRTFADSPVIVQLALCLLAAYIVYVATTALVAAGVGIDLKQSMLQVWKEQYAWLATSYVGMGFVAYALIFGYNNNHFLGIILMVVPLVLLRLSQKQYVDRTRTMVNELHDKQRSLEKTAEEIRDLNNGLLDTLAEIIDLGDPYVLGHSLRVAQLATGIASRLGLPDRQIELIRNASMLHDIGKLGISAALLAKPSKLTPEEYETVKRHVPLGSALIEKSHPLRPLAPIIGCHHEHFDGKGYPNRLKGKEIPLEARIIAVSDAIETMSSDRPYRKRMTFEKIVEELQNCSGSQFDPLIVEAAVTLLTDAAKESALAPQRTVPTLNAASLLKM